MTNTTALSIVLDLSLSRTLVVRDIERRLATHGIGLSDLALLLELYDSTGHQAQRADIAERLGVTTSGVARQLLPLERIGLVSRVSDAKDARRAHVVLTEAGIRTVEEVTPEAEERAQQVLRRRWTKREQELLAGLLAKSRID